MSQFEKLTDGEYKRLALLGKELKRIRMVTNEDVYWTFRSVMDGREGIPISAALSGEVQDSLKRAGHSLEQIRANTLHIKRWAEAGYISLSPANDSRFIITPRGIDYLKYQNHRRVIRWLIDLWSDWRTDLRSAIISIIVTVITAYLILKLGLR